MITKEQMKHKWHHNLAGTHWLGYQHSYSTDPSPVPVETLTPTTAATILNVCMNECMINVSSSCD